MRDFAKPYTIPTKGPTNGKRLLANRSKEYGLSLRTRLYACNTTEDLLKLADELEVTSAGWGTVDKFCQAYNTCSEFISVNGKGATQAYLDKLAERKLDSLNKGAQSGQP